MQTVTGYGNSLVVAISFFVVLLGVSIFLLLRVPLGSSADKKQTNYQVVHFTLRVALTLGIGAVIVAVLLVAALFWLRFTLCLQP